MATRKTSQAQQKDTPHPFTQLPGMDLWKSMLESQNERFEQLATEMERMEKERYERTLGAIDEMAKLMKSSFEYNQQLGAQWRELALEAARKSASVAGGNN